MNITQMHLAIQQGVDKINSFQADSLLPEEIDLEINKAISRFINLKYGKNNLHGKGFEESQKRIDDLRSLVIDSHLKVEFLNKDVNNTFVYASKPLPAEYRYLIKCSGTIVHNSSCTTLSEAEQTIEKPVQNSVKSQQALKFCQQDDLYTLLADPFNGTKKTKPLYTVQENLLKIYTNDIFIINNIKITFIKNPAIVSLSLGASSDLPLHTHQEIVDMTISSILEGISDPRYRTQSIELGKNE